ncbi:hypothetical protein QNI19_26730 [Cytophagaceae bacterium DM2B3-1]|uniref:Uncharacterized protein n=1 Tax=Xanthocytophaga flava TaxID=3048013 RepID=A0ABT7CS61_9BACT|nr:hypothetical protein [Xanthocytophaga flavus]MDJ1496557.1 hypothetical protein [Xanthocytophaga flavus]
MKAKKLLQQIANGKAVKLYKPTVLYLGDEPSPDIEKTRERLKSFTPSTIIDLGPGIPPDII